MHLLALQKKRHDAFTAAKALSTRIGARNPNPTEKTEYDGLIATVKDCDAQIQHIEALSKPSQPGRREGQSGQQQYNKVELDAAFGDLSAWLGGASREIRAESIFETSGNTAGIPATVLPTYFEELYAVDLGAQLGVNEYVRNSIEPLTVPIPVSVTTIGEVDETDDPGSAIPAVKYLTLGGTKFLGYTALSYETIAKLLGNPGVPNNVDLSQLVTVTLAKGIIQAENTQLINQLFSQIRANAHAISTFNDGSLVSLFARLKSSLALQYRSRAKWLFGQAGEDIIRAAVDSLGRPLFDLSSGELLGDPFVVSPDIADDALFYGDPFSAIWRSRSTFYLRMLDQVRATAGQNVFMGYQFSDVQTFASVSSDVTRQPMLLTSLLGGASS